MITVSVMICERALSVLPVSIQFFFHFCIRSVSKMNYYSKNKAFRSCITLAEDCPACEAAEYYRLAVMLDPVSEEGYLGLIRCMKEGNEAPGLLREAFSAAEYDRTVRNIENLRTNEEGYDKVVSALGRTEGFL